MRISSSFSPSISHYNSTSTSFWCRYQCALSFSISAHQPFSNIRSTQVHQQLPKPSKTIWIWNYSTAYHFVTRPNPQFLQCIHPASPLLDTLTVASHILSPSPVPSGGDLHNDIVSNRSQLLSASSFPTSSSWEISDFHLHLHHRRITHFWRSFFSSSGIFI